MRSRTVKVPCLIDGCEDILTVEVSGSSPARGFDPPESIELNVDGCPEHQDAYFERTVKGYKLYDRLYDAVMDEVEAALDRCRDGSVDRGM